MIDFKNSEVGFKHLSDKELKQQLRIFGLMRHSWLIKIGQPLLYIANFLRIPLRPFLGKIYSVFVAGNTLESAEAIMLKMKQYNIMSVPDYSAESNESELERDKVAAEIERGIIYASKHRDMVPFAVFKPSGISSVELLTKKSEGKAFNQTESQQWEALVKRWKNIFSLAAKNKVSVMVDAEESWYQQAIDDLVFDFMLEFNKEMPVVINTLQMYRNDRLEFLKKTIEFARVNKLWVGVKFVRGAYHEKESKRAIKNKYPHIVYQTKADTDAAFDEALEISMSNIDIMTIFCATHNENSNVHLTQLMQKNNIEPDDRRVWFSQLYGMSNHISFGLAEKNYNVVKYLPYAPIRVVMPYLIRRAQENSSMKGQTLREYSMIKEEYNRRKQNK
jgi:proline dehydrogenase